MKFHYTSKAHKSAFTLIELLVVIAIIAILAAILFPVFSRARDNARRSSCQSNLKQMGLAFMQYSQDYDESLPCGKKQGSEFRGNGWAGQVAPYTKSIEVFRCPSDPTERSGAMNPLLSYAYNSGITYILTPTNYNGPRLAAFTSTPKTVLLFEIRASSFNPTLDSDFSRVESGYSPAGCGWPGGNLQPNSGGTVSPYYATGYFPNMSANYGRFDGTNVGSGKFGRHFEGSNYAFADGHVKWMKPSSISAGLAAPSPDAPEVANENVYPYNAAGTNVSTRAATFSPI